MRRDKAKIMANHEGRWDEMMLRCSVGCDDFMVFTVEDLGALGADQEWWIEVSLIAEMRPHSFRDFLSTCWQLFRRGRWHRASADLNRDGLLAVRDWCQYALDKTEGPLAQPSVIEDSLR